MNLELNYLKDFVILAETCHFQEAASIRFTSQSTLSKHIKAIETELGEELFIRSRKCTELTDFGKRFLPYAQKMLDIQQDYTSELLKVSTSDKVVSFGYIPMLTLYNFTVFFTDYIKENPACQYNIVQDNSERLLSLLEMNQLEFILTGPRPLPQEEYEKVLYTRDHLAVLLPAGHPLAGSEAVDIGDLQDENLLTFANSIGRTNYLERLFPGYHFRTSVSIEKKPVLYDFVRKGIGVSVLPHWVASHPPDGEVVRRPVTPLTCVDFYMVYRKKRRLSPLTRAFSDYLKKRNGMPPE